MATVYVSPTGSDAYTYVQAQSSATPWLTIGKCETSATTGDTIIVMTGTHTFANVTFTKNFTIQGASTDKSLYVFDAAAASRTWTLGANTISLRYLTFNNITNTGVAIFTYIASANITVANCAFTNLTALAASNSNFLGGVFGNATSTNIATIALSITNCIFDNVDFSTSTASSTIIALKGLQAGTFTFNKNIIHMSTNSFYPTQIFSTGTVVTPTYTNNILYNVSGQAILFTFAGGLSSATYNDFYLITTAPSGTGNITSDPLLVDPSNGNYNLQQDSPCIGTGTT